MSIDRTSEEYKRRKLAHQLVTSELWNDLLLPELERIANRRLVPITTMDLAFTVTHDQGKQAHAIDLIARMERLSQQFTEYGDGPNVRLHGRTRQDSE